MQDCISASADTAPIVPNKRVNYAFGMVLGVKDFVQEQAHFEWKARLSNHLPHGYGTLCGLGVQLVEIKAGGVTTDFQIKIEPGFAISPLGHWLWLEDELCALLAAWVAKNKDKRPAPDAAGPDKDKNHVYVRLCYAECSTDAVPIAANPCASSEDNTAASRILETIAADFSWTAPAQDEVSKTADYGALLAAETDIVKVHADLTEWATDKRPALSKSGCLPPDDSDDCLLLARVTFLYVAATDTIDFTTVILHPEERPVLADTRLLQEWLAALQIKGMKAGDPAGGDLSGTYPNPFVETSHGKVLIKVGDAAGGDLSGTYPDPFVETSHGKVIIKDGDAAGGDLAGTYPNPTIAANVIKLGDAAGGDLSGAYPNPFVETSHGKVLIKVGDAAGGDLSGPYPNPFVETSHGKILIKQGDAAGGDLFGTYPDPTVVQLQGRKVANTLPTDQQVLTWVDANQDWEPQSLPIAAIVQPVLQIPVLELASVQSQSFTAFRFWFHLAPGLDNHITLQKPGAGMVEVFAETAAAGPNPPFLSPVAVQQAVPAAGLRNVWDITLAPGNGNSPLLRFVFHLSAMQIRETPAPATPAVTLLNLVEQQRLRWEGFDGQETVTLFFNRGNLG